MSSILIFWEFFPTSFFLKPTLYTHTSARSVLSYIESLPLQWVRGSIIVVAFKSQSPAIFKRREMWATSSSPAQWFLKPYMMPARPEWNQSIWHSWLHPSKTNIICDLLQDTVDFKSTVILQVALEYLQKRKEMSLAELLLPRTSGTVSSLLKHARELALELF